MALDANGNTTAATLYAPYGVVRYSSGTMPGSYGFTGQRADAVTGLDDYGSRYYDPAAGQFTSADLTLPSGGFALLGLSRYAYVEGDPEARLDPSGHDWFSSIVNTVTSAATAAAPAAVAVLDATTGIPSMIHDVQTICSGNASTMDKVLAGADLLLNVAMDVSMLVGVGEGLRAAYIGAKIAGHIALDVAGHAAEHAGEDAAEHVAEHAVEDLGEHAAEDGAADAAGDAAGDAAEACGESFAAGTPVATPQGERPIAALKVGDTVVAVDPRTGKATTRTVEAVLVHHDTDLLDVTLRTPGATAAVGTRASAPAARTLVRAVVFGVLGLVAALAAPLPTLAQPLRALTAAVAPRGAAANGRDETIHTTTSHPWLTADHGWVRAGALRLGEPVVRADGAPAVVVALHVVPGAAPMWDLTVSQVHTFAVGAGEYVVHNCPKSIDPADQAKLDKFRAKYETRELPDGRTRFYEKFKPAANPGDTAGGRWVREFNPDTGEWRSWYETYRADGSVYAVHPKLIGGDPVNLPHYWFDHGRFLGTF